MEFNRPILRKYRIHYKPQYMICPVRKRKVIDDWCVSLRRAAYKNDKLATKFLLKRASCINHDYNPLLIALSHNDESLIHEVIGAMRHVWTGNKETVANILILARCPLFPIVSEDYVLDDIVETMKKKGVYINNRGPDKLPALHAAVFRRNKSLIENLLRSGAFINSRDQVANTPLHTASISGRGYEIAKLLLARGADVNVRNAYGHTPLYYAHYYRQENERLTWLLLENGAVLRPRDKCLRAAAHFAFNRSRYDAIDHFLECENDIDVEDSDGNTILHLAAERFKEELFLELLRRGADIYYENQNGMSPLTLYFDNIYMYKNENVQMRVLQFYFDYGGGNCVDFVGSINYPSIFEQCYRINWLLGNRDQLTSMLALCLEQLAKLTIRNIRVSWLCLSLIYTSKHLKDYLYGCEQELKIMAKTKVYKNVTFYNILVDHTAKMATYARNEALVESFENTDYFRMFPFYSQALMNKLHKAVEKRTLIKNAAIAIRHAFYFIIPLDVIEEVILPYLNEYDMLKVTDGQ